MILPDYCWMALKIRVSLFLRTGSFLLVQKGSVLQMSILNRGIHLLNPENFVRMNEQLHFLHWLAIICGD